ncbi:hypothetical protein [Nocardia sp. alder85J]|nr:hypothetical protein [Nocardia sp. alder85J]MCX4093594.1 hypothetical protein [Nocardia sp. alder85J]
MTELSGGVFGKRPGNSLGEITSKTSIPKASLHRYLTPATEQEQ